jgi:YesN/AraC family two-component response regulator
LTGKIRVVVADDEALVRDGLRAIAELEGDIEIVGDAASGGEAAQLAWRPRAPSCASPGRPGSSS